MFDRVAGWPVRHHGSGDRLDPGRARRRYAGRRPRPDAAAARSARSRRRASSWWRPTPACSPRARCRSPNCSTRSEWIEANLRSMRPMLEPLADRLGDGCGPGDAGRARGGRGRCWPSRSAWSWATSRAGCWASTSWCCWTRRRPRTAVRGPQPRRGRHGRSAPTRTTCCAGWPCTRSLTRSSSRACRGCASTWAGCCAR